MKQLTEEELDHLEFVADELECSTEREECHEKVTHRVGTVCCQRFDLYCRRHAMMIQRWINLHAKDDMRCSIHKIQRKVPELLKVFPL